MAKPFPQHELITKALAARLIQIYPEIKATYKEGAEIPVGNTVRKPDLFISYGDRKWIYEAVHKNHHINKLVQTHELYRQGGFIDHWILWETLQPFSSALGPSSGQYSLPKIDWNFKLFNLSALHTTILDMQSREPKYLFSFTPNRLRGEVTLDNALGRLLTIGFYIYEFIGWHGERKFPAKVSFVPLTDLEFTPEGYPAKPDETIQERIIQRAIDLAEISFVENYTAHDVNSFTNEITNNNEIQQKWFMFVLTASFEQLSDAEKRELIDFFQQKLVFQNTFQGNIDEINLNNLLDDPKLMKLLSSKLSLASNFLDSLPVPKFFKKMINWTIDAQKIFLFAGLMDWQEKSPELKAVRN